MDSQLMIMSSNKEVAIVRATEEFCAHLRDQGFDELAQRACIAPTHFLVDSPFAEHSLDVGIFPHKKREELMNNWFRRVFELELAELGLPLESWPDTSSVAIFQTFFSVTYRPLAGDVGSLPLRTHLAPL
jgi:hypothetical protein